MGKGRPADRVIERQIGRHGGFRDIMGKLEPKFKITGC
jgi:hypothetical protein